MATLKANTVSGIGTEGPVLNGGLHFSSQNYMTLPKGDSVQGGRGRGMIMGGFHPAVQTMEYVSIQSQGNSIAFGDMSTPTQGWGSALASSTRACIGGGGYPSNINTIEFVTIAVTSNTTNFGDLTAAKVNMGTCSSQVRGLIAGGNSTPVFFNNIDFITIASTGDAQDFGDINNQATGVRGLSSPTRGVFAGGGTPTRLNVIDFVTIATTGNASDFGDLNTATIPAAASNNTRGIIAGGYIQPSGPVSNFIDFITIATTGNATDFGDLFENVYNHGGMASETRALFVGAYQLSPYSQGYKNIIQFCSIQTTGNGLDFGDMLVNRGQNDGSTSDCHGGLAE